MKLLKKGRKTKLYKWMKLYSNLIAQIDLYIMKNVQKNW